MYIILYFSILLHCIVQWVLQRAALLYVVFHCLSLHVSAYMAIFRYVGVFIYIYFDIFKDPSSLLFWFTAFFLRGHNLRVFHLCFVPVLFSFVFFFGVFLLMLQTTTIKSKQTNT
jgi:hypothetical protein